MTDFKKSSAVTRAGGASRRFLSAPAVVVALTLLGAVLRFWGIGHQGLWYDESVTSLLVSRSPGVMLGLIPHTESTPPLYYCAEWVWTHVFGHGPAGLRSMSALAGTLLIPVAYLTASKLVSDRVGVISAALTACNPFLIWYSQEARAYESLALLAGVSLLAFAYLMDDPRPRWWIAWAIASALAILTHYYGVIVVIPEALMLWRRYGRRRELVLAGGAIGVVALALVPLILAQSGTGHDGWIANSPLGIRLGQIIPQFLIGTDMPLRKPFKWVAFVLAVTALVMAVRWLRESEREGTRRALLLTLGGFGLSLLFILGHDDTLITRNVIDLWLPAAIVVAAGLGAAWDHGAAAQRAVARGAALTATIGLCAIGVYATAAIAHDYYFERPNWVPLARLLGPPPAPGTTRVILIQHYAYRLPLGLYMPNLTYLRGDDVTNDTVEIDVIRFSAPGQPLCWWGAACNLVPSTIQAHYDIGDFQPVSKQTVEQFTVLKLRSRKGEAVTSAEIAAALTTTTLKHDVILIQRPATG
jgi:4-amino-4-deoxy-L-arabinose transferase-like glycosyltransferase